MTLDHKWQEAPMQTGGLAWRTIILSALLHVLLVLAVWRLAPLVLPEVAQTANNLLWAEVANPPSSNGRIVDLAKTANNRTPDSTSHLARQNHKANRQTYLKDFPKNRFGGPPRPTPKQAVPHKGSQSQADKSLTGPSFNKQALPSATQLLNQSSFGEYLTSRTSQGMYNPGIGVPADAVDINTSEHKYVGYFMSLKERIETYWRRLRPYYDRARSGQLVMTLQEDGTLTDVTLIRSCGDHMLDLAILDAIRQASPFNPLPASWNQEKLTISFEFHYLVNRRGMF